MKSPTPNPTNTTAKTEASPQTDHPDLINDGEFESLVTMALAHHPHSTHELEEVVKWAEKVRIEETVLRMVLDRQLCAFFGDDGQIWHGIPPEHREHIEGKVDPQEALLSN